VYGVERAGSAPTADHRTPGGLPSHVRALAAKERLGGLERSYEPGQEHRRAKVWLVIFAIPGLILLPFTIHFILGGIGYASVLSLALTIVYLGAAGHILVRQVLPGEGRAAYLFEGGLVHQTGRRSAVAFPWDGVAEVRVSGVRNGSTEAITWRFTIVGDDRRETVLGSELTEVGALLEHVSAKVTERLLPKYLARIEAGGAVDIGPFTVGGAGVAKGGWNVRWDRIHAVGMDNGMVYVSRTDGVPAMTVPAAQMPNAVAFTALVEHLIKAARSNKIVTR
jgi:hypothetical protein